MKFTVYNETTAEDNEYFYKYDPENEEVVHYPKKDDLKMLTIMVTPDKFISGEFRNPVRRS